MNLKVLLPFQIFVEKKGVKRIVAHTLQGSFGLLAHRLDCTAALAPGILTYESEAGQARSTWPSIRGCWSRRAWTFWSRCATRSAGRTSTNSTRP